MEKKIKEELISLSKQLRMPAFRHELDERILQAQTRSLGYEDFLLEILQEECSAREENRKKEHIRSAGFPQYKYLYDLSKEDLPLEASQKLAVLESLDFIQTGQNVILAGNSGTGKTHIATGLGIKACQKGYKVLFTTVSRLLTQLRESRAERTLRSVWTERDNLLTYWVLLPT